MDDSRYNIHLDFPFEDRAEIINRLIEALLRVNTQGMPGDQCIITFRSKKMSGKYSIQTLSIHLN